MGKSAAALVLSLAVGAAAGFVLHTRAAGAEVLPPSGVQAKAPSPARATFVRAAKPVPAVRPARPAAEPSPATLRIPRLELATRIFAPSGLNRGPAWWPITGRPGGGDTVAIAGHRTTYTRPFYWLERMRPGDRIEVTYLGRRHVYRVTRSRVISASNLHIGDAVGHERLLLTACTPRGSAAFRLVVEARPA